MRTVLLLGAGASAASMFALPTMANLFTAASLGDAPEDLKAFLHGFNGDRPYDAWNLEEIMAFLDLQRTREVAWRYERGREVPNSERIYEQLLKFVVLRLSIPQVPCDLHVRLLRTLADRDSVITMNYDLVVDHALANLQPRGSYGHFEASSRLGKIGGLIGELDLLATAPPSLIPREMKNGFYLKLHGSLDWLQCPTLGCHGNINLYWMGLVHDPDGNQAEGRPCRHCGAALRTTIIPPVARKHIEDRGRFAFLWHLAWRELIEAERIVVGGLSLPPTDFELRWLLRYACQVRPLPIKELIVINPNESHWSVVRNAFPCEVSKFEPLRSFEDYLGLSEKAGA